MSAALHRFPREATAYNVTPIRPTMYDEAYAELLSAGADWPTMLRCAETLSHSRCPAHRSLSKHTFTSHSLRLEELLKPVDPRHRDRSDLIDGWKEAALAAEAAEAPVKDAMRYRPELLALGAGVALAVVAAVVFAKAVLS
jgi:hypothetical protein